MTAISTNATPPSNGNETHFETSGQTLWERAAGAAQFCQPGVLPGIAHCDGSPGASGTKPKMPQRAAVVVVNQTLAKRYFPNENPIGHSIKFPDLTNEPPFNLVPQQQGKPADCRRH
jgi:hypothetical protein